MAFARRTPPGLTQLSESKTNGKIEITRRRFLVAIGATAAAGTLAGAGVDRFVLPEKTVQSQNGPVQDTIFAYLYGTPNGTQTLSYDSTGRVSKVTYGSLTVQLSYDQNGNLSQAISTIGSTTMTEKLNYDSAGRLISVTVS